MEDKMGESTAATLQLRYELDGEEFQVLVDNKDFLIGRAPSCSLVLADESVSRRHARITCDGANWTLSDLSSKNGIKVNTYRAAQQRLRDGDRIDLGAVRLYVGLTASRVPVPADVVFEASEDRGRRTEIIDVAQLDSLLASRDVAGGISQLRASPLDSDGSSDINEEAASGLRLFGDAAEALISCDSLDETLDRIMELVFRNFPVERGVICFYDEETNTTVPQVMRTLAGKGGEPIRISSAIANDVIQRKQSLLVNDPLLDERFGGAESVIALNIRSAMCAPLYREGRVNGFIYVDCQSVDDGFSSAHLEALSALGILSAVAVEQTSLRDHLRSEQEMRARLSRYSSPAVVDRILDGSSEAGGMATDEADVTVVFADLCGFTSMAEALRPAETVRMLNQVFERLTEAIFEFDGTLDKFRGDGLMAFFGAPLPMPDHADRAVRSALRMQELINELNSYTENRKLQIRIGIQSGAVVVGDIGSPQRKDYTVIGDVVNTASRLESAVALPGEVVVGEATWERLASRFEGEPLEPAHLKGKREAVQSYRVSGVKPASSD
jgi:adenylate cyclase